MTDPNTPQAAFTNGYRQGQEVRLNELADAHFRHWKEGNDSEDCIFCHVVAEHMQMLEEEND